MYKQKTNKYLNKIKILSFWIIRKFILLLAAFMLGTSNVIYEENKMITGNENKIEQNQKDD